MGAKLNSILAALGLSTFLLWPTPSRAQQVRFDNAVLRPYLSDHQVLVSSFLGGPLTGTNWVAQLYYGTSASTLVVNTAEPRRFRPATTSEPGTWMGANRTLSGLSTGSLAVLAVRIWDFSQAATYEQAIATGSLWKDCGPFYYETKPDGLSPTNYFMFDFDAANHFGPRCEDATRYVSNAPLFESQPLSVTIGRGQDITLAATVTNACLGHWRFNGNFVGEGGGSLVAPGLHPFHTRYTLSLTNAELSHSGSYQFIAENYAGSTTSQVAVVTIVAPAQLTSVRHDNGAFAFYVSEDTGRSVAIETAPDLNPGTTWTPVFTNTAPFSFTNSPATDRQRFYRTVFR